MSKKIRQIVYTAHYQYIEWLLNGKQIIVLIILFFLMKHVSDPLIEFSKKIGSPLQWAETFLSAMNSSYLIPIICICFITLMSEFPKRDYGDINIFFRVGRTNWYYGQILFSVYAVITFLIETAALFVIRILPVAYPANGWSPFIKGYMEKYLEAGREYGVVAVVESEVYNHFAPTDAFFYTLLLLAGLFWGICLIMMVCNLFDKKAVGIVINIFLVVLGVGMLYMKSDYLRFFPIGNAVLSCQNRPVTRLTEWYEPLLYYAVCGIVFIVIGRIRVKKVRL